MKMNMENRTLSYLNSKLWYRLLKVFFCLIILATLLIGNAIFVGDGVKRIDNSETLILCIGKKEIKTLTPEQIGIKLQNYQFKNGFNYQRFFEGYNDGAIKAILKGCYKTADTVDIFVMQKYQELGLQDKKLISDEEWKKLKAVESAYSWDKAKLLDYSIKMFDVMPIYSYKEFFKLFIVTNLIILLSFEILRRIFYYIVLGTIKPKSESILHRLIIKIIFSIKKFIQSVFQIIFQKLKITSLVIKICICVAVAGIIGIAGTNFVYDKIYDYNTNKNLAKLDFISQAEINNKKLEVTREQNAVIKNQAVKSVATSETKKQITAKCQGSLGDLILVSTSYALTGWDPELKLYGLIKNNSKCFVTNIKLKFSIQSATNSDVKQDEIETLYATVSKGGYSAIEKIIIGPQQTKAYEEYITPSDIFLQKNNTFKTDVTVITQIYSAEWSNP